MTASSTLRSLEWELKIIKVTKQDRGILFWAIWTAKVQLNEEEIALDFLQLS
jgi:hypothetical protein